MIENRMVIDLEGTSSHPHIIAEYFRSRIERFAEAEAKMESLTKAFSREGDSWKCHHCNKQKVSVSLSFGGTLRLSCRVCRRTEMRRVNA